MSQAVYSIKTETFEGPMELLIELVEKRKLLINDISLAEVTDEYMATVSVMQEMSIPNTAQFVALAATLLLIKSKSLLPILDLTTEEESSIDDLESRLKLYQIFRDASLLLKDRYARSSMYAPEYAPPKNPMFIPDELCTIESLQSAMAGVLNELPKEKPKPSARVRTTITLEEMMSKLKIRIEKQLRTKFSEISAGETDRKVVIVGFLAILELFKQGNLIITQGSHFEDIHIEFDRAGTPRYY